MGRLIRKKTTIKPKKKKTEGETGQPDSVAVRHDVKPPTPSPAKPRENPSKISGIVSGAVMPLKGGFAQDNFIGKSLQFLREVKIELKKVTWPSRKQTLGSTAVVIVLVILISLFLGVVDVSLSSLIRVVIQ